MIAGMVENLAARLKLDGADLDGWQRLIRSYVTLKKPDQARAALASARSQFAGDTASVAALDALARGLELQP